uniref:Ribosome biogenesis inhibitor MINAS-60 n=1 Tax=Homo sapiens TaxID=9606 RepID=MNS60_HUMAN|nr:RecName: Full=Ribosome biogenesis inhibitor MINAS-60; Short=MINAS-60 [Homo sapiens]
MKDVVVVVTGLAAMEPLTARRMMVGRTAAETTTTGTWTTVHILASMAARRASMTMTTHLRSRVRRIPTRPPRAPRLSVGGGGGTGTAPPARQASPETATIGTRTIGPSKGRRRRRRRMRRRRRRPVTSSC